MGTLVKPAALESQQTKRQEAWKGASWSWSSHGLAKAKLEAGPPVGSSAMQKPEFAVPTQDYTHPKQGSAAFWGLISVTLCLKSLFLKAKHICQSPIL